MFAGTAMCSVVHGNMHSNVLVNVQCTPYKIVLQMHVLFELLTATVELNFNSHAIHSFLG